MSQCDDDREVETDSSESKCVTLEDISAVGVSNAANAPNLKDLLFLRKELLHTVHDSSDCGEENASLEAIYGDESSCCVSDVSSLSFQNAVLEDTDYNSGVASQAPGERSSAGSEWAGNDLQDASELSEIPNELSENLDDFAQGSDDLPDAIPLEDDAADVTCKPDDEMIPEQFECSEVPLDAPLDRGACVSGTDPEVVPDVVGSDKCGLSQQSSSKGGAEPSDAVTEKESRRKSGMKNHEHVVGRSQQHLKNSPGMARRLLTGEEERDSISVVGSSNVNEESQHTKQSVADSSMKEEMLEEQEMTDGGNSVVGEEKDFQDDSDDSKDDTQRSKDQEKRERIAHMDALYKKQIEALMLNQQAGDSPESPKANADVENEYNYTRYTRVQNKEMYFGMKVERQVAEKSASSVSETGNRSTSSMLQKDAEPETPCDIAELSLDAAESDLGDATAVPDEKSLTCHMPSVEDGLSSGHASDCDETLNSKHDPSPSEILNSRLRSEVQHRPSSAPQQTAKGGDAFPDTLSKSRQKNVEQAIQDIKSAIEKSKKVKLISPTATPDEPTKPVNEKAQEPVWITRKEQVKDSQRQGQSESSSFDSGSSQKGSKNFSASKGAQSVTRKHNKKYVSVPSNDQEDDAESSVESQNKTQRSPSPEGDPSKSSAVLSHRAVAGTTGNGCATTVGRGSPDCDVANGRLPSSRRVEADSRDGRAVAPESTSKMEEQRGMPTKCRHHGKEITSEFPGKQQSRAVEGEYSTDEETDELLNKQYTRSETVDIPELSSSPLSRSQSERRQNRAREVALRDPTDETVLIEGVLFRANYLGSTQLVSEGQPSKGMRMMQAQEAVGRIKAPDGETQPSTEVDLFVSVEKIMVLNTDLQEIMMDHALRTISYIADIGDILVIMARRGPIMNSAADASSRRKSQTKICCHVFESDEAQLIAQSIGQAFQVSYMEFLKANGIENPSHIRELDYQEVLNQQEIFGEELYLFSNREMQKEIIVPKVKGEPLGIVVVESGWGSMVPTVVLANMSPTGSAARCGQLNIGDQIMSINGISLVGLPLSSCQNYIKAARHHSVVKLAVISCPPVVEVLIKRPDIKYQLGFSVQNGVICSLLRGGIAERGGIRVGHRIIEINGQSVVAVSHDKIVHMLATSVGEIQMKTMPTSIFRLLTGQDVPHYI